jgi:hypothetical protein
MDIEKGCEKHRGISNLDTVEAHFNGGEISTL